MRFRLISILVVACAGFFTAARADDFIHRMEGDELPDQMADPWVLTDRCAPVGDCFSLSTAGWLEIHTIDSGGGPSYLYVVVPFPETPPDSFWVEARFASNDPQTVANFCDGRLSVNFDTVNAVFWMFGDRVSSHGLEAIVTGLPLNAPFTVRFESPDGSAYTQSVNGLVFRDAVGTSGSINTGVGFSSDGGCSSNPTVNRWDYIRFGTLSTGERITATFPPSGFVGADFARGFDRFSVTFEAANYAYVDDISVASIGGEAPEVIATRRRDGDGPETFEVVLDRPIPARGQTRFIFDDGTTRNIVDYSFIRGDSSGDGAIDLRDFRDLQQCFGQAAAKRCTAFDFDGDDTINTTDAASFLSALTPPRE